MNKTRTLIKINVYANKPVLHLKETFAHMSLAMEEFLDIDFGERS